MMRRDWMRTIRPRRHCNGFWLGRLYRRRFRDRRREVNIWACMHGSRDFQRGRMSGRGCRFMRCRFLVKIERCGLIRHDRRFRNCRRRNLGLGLDICLKLLTGDLDHPAALRACEFDPLSRYLLVRDAKELAARSTPCFHPSTPPEPGQTRILTKSIVLAHHTACFCDLL